MAVARSVDALEDLAAASGPVVACPTDIGTDASIGAIAEALPGTVRAVVNSAAAPMGGTITDVAPEALTGAVEVKVNGTLRLVRAVDERLTTDSRIIAIGG
ncbi:MAG: short-chain dehydrogenase, partial [Gammaproteobacteria bacterium]|nr:short-chain dehydrogenase [Gammaproteobacteria bacterium]